MLEKEITIPLIKLLPLPDKKGDNRKYIEIIIEEDIPIHCINESTRKKRLMPFKVLYDNNENFWQNSGNWHYYITQEDHEKLKEKAAVKAKDWDAEKAKSVFTAKNCSLPADEKLEKIEKLEELEELETDKGFGSEYKTFANMSTEEKIEYLNQNKMRLNELVINKNKDTEIVTEALVDTAKDAALINHSVLKEAIHLADDEAKKFTQGFVDTTNEMVKSSALLFSEDVFNDKLMNTLVEKSNGTIVQHMTRVYLNGIAFLAYYNNLVTTSSAIQRIRLSFSSKYRDYYQKLLPHLSTGNIVLERVFYGGMRAIPPELLYKWAVGFLIHDIGKASAIEYHEGETAYDRNKVIEHVKIGYKSILSKTNYPLEASLITGYHHEYYGDSSGYGYFRAYLQQYRKQNPDAKQDYCMTYELEPILDYIALAYFPAKVLEIVDVFDSVTDPSRIYHKALSADEALVMMREEFIEKSPKIDAILFDIFAAFIMDKQKKAD